MEFKVILWDNFLRYFTYDTAENLNNELELMVQKNIELVPVEYYGSPLASYMYDFRNESNSNMLGGYNIIKFSKLFGLGIVSFRVKGIVSFRDKLISKTIYTPLKYPNVLFPIVYKNGILNIYSKTYRSYKHLLKQMNTRKARDYLFDNLTQYGRRAMTILDPYGIFMHFHTGHKALKPS